MRYIIYSRVSDAKQDTDYQNQLCIDYVKSQGADKYMLFSDPYLSGASRNNRPELQKMMEIIRKKDVVVVYKQDRISRDTVDTLQIVREIFSRGATFHSLTDPYSDELSLTIRAAFAQKEREDTVMKTKAKLKYKADNNLRISHAIPYGFYLDTENLVAIKRRDKILMLPGHLLPDEKEQVVLKKMQNYFDMGYSYGLIAKMLTGEGHMNREGNPFHKSSIYRILLKSGRRREVDQSPVDSDCQMILI